MVKEHACQCRGFQRHRFNPWVGKDPLEKGVATTPVILPGESHGQSHWFCLGLRGFSWRWGWEWVDGKNELNQFIISYAQSSTVAVNFQAQLLIDVI